MAEFTSTTNRFYRGERLKSRKEIGRLFNKTGQSLNAYPIRLVYAAAAEKRSSFPYQAAFVVPKRRFKKAVDRNRIKRRIREAYRLQKHLLPQGERSEKGGGAQVRSTAEGASAQYALMFIYTGKTAMPYAYIERKMKKVIEQLEARLLGRG